MIEKNFINIYTKFKLEFYKKIFSRFQEREASLTAVEIFCVETIYVLNKPTIQEFANFIDISSPNAAYKVQSLIKKGYLKKLRSSEDKREFNLEVTDKFLEYYGITYDYTTTLVNKIKERFSQEDIQKLDEMLAIISNELMPEIDQAKKKQG